jgi:hypothetical protein
MRLPGIAFFGQASFVLLSKKTQALIFLQSGR